jgi:Tol biopolymer transport system component
VTTRFLGSTTAVGRDLLYFDQLEIRRNVGVYSDLYVLRRSDGRVRQMTRESRLRDPDLSPDGETLVCVKDGRGQRDLVLVGLPASAITTLISEPETQFDTPRWSPDGRTIAVERHRPGSLPEIVLVDRATKAVRVVAAAPETRFLASRRPGDCRRGGPRG